MKFIYQLAGALRGHFGTSLILAVLIGAAGPAVAARSTRPEVDALSQASEIAEQLSENAPTADAAAFAKSMADLSALNARLSASVQEAEAWWTAIEPHTSDATLKEAMNRTLLGMRKPRIRRTGHRVRLPSQ